MYTLYIISYLFRRIRFNFSALLPCVSAVMPMQLSSIYLHLTNMIYIYFTITTLFFLKMLEYSELSMSDAYIKCCFLSHV